MVAAIYGILHACPLRASIASDSSGPKLQTLQNIVIEYYGSMPSLSCYYLGAWLVLALPAANVTFHGVPGEVGHVGGVMLSGGDLELAFRRVEGDTVQISGAQSNIVVLPHATDCRAMREELTITGADPMFDRVYDRAEQLRRDSQLPSTAPAL